MSDSKPAAGRKPRVYISHAVTGVPDSVMARLRAVATSVSTAIHDKAEILECIGRYTEDAVTVVRHDLRCVRSCDLFIAIAEVPSMGLGCEVMAAIEAHKPVILLYRRDVPAVSQFVHGLSNESSSYHPCSYLPDFKLPDAILGMLEEVSSGLPPSA